MCNPCIPVHIFRVPGRSRATQDVLNLAFARRWAPLDLAWNAQGLGSYARFRTTHQPAGEGPDQPALFTPTSLQALCSGGAQIVHFSGACSVGLGALGAGHAPPTHKPWHGVCASPYTAEWFKVLDAQTPWRGWRPDQVRARGLRCVCVGFCKRTACTNNRP